MKTNFTRLLLITALFFTALGASAQSVGDFRSNFSGTVGAWTPAATVSNWERFDGTTWVAMPVASYPTAADGVITIQAGDSVTLSGGASGISIDQVVIEPGGVLAVFSNIAGTKPNVADGAGDDIIVNGRMYVATGGILNGPGNIQVNSGGLFTLRVSGILSAPTTVDGTLHLGNTGVSAGNIQSTTMTLNGSGVWIDGIANLSTGASFINNGTLVIETAGTQWSNTGASNSIVNNGTINKVNNNTTTIATPFTNSSTGVVNINSGSINFSNSTVGTIANAGTFLGATGTTTTFNNLNNSGTLGGNGTYAFSTVSLTNTGIVSPGTSPGILSVPTATFTGKAATLRTEIAGTSNVAGTDYDQVNVTGGALNLTTTTLDFSNTGTAPDGTQFTILTSVGAITGPFASSNLTSNFTITYNTNSVVVTKIAQVPLPVRWGEFKAVSQGNRVLLDWTTMMEENTSHFVIEHSTSGNTFTPVANITAQGNSTYEAKYKYTFTTPDLSRTNYFRIKQVDIDGKSTYSVTRSVKFDKGQVVAIQVYPNPVKDVLQLNIQRENIQVLLTDQSGKSIQRASLQPGQHTIDMQALPTGIYQLTVFEKGVRIETKKIMKQ